MLSWYGISAAFGIICVLFHSCGDSISCVEHETIDKPVSINEYPVLLSAIQRSNPTLSNIIGPKMSVHI